MGPVQTITTCLRKSFSSCEWFGILPSRFRISIAGDLSWATGIVMGALFPVGDARAQDDVALSAAISVCSSKTIKKDAAIAALLEGGWMPAPSNTQEPFGAVFSAQFAFAYKTATPEDIDYSLLNAYFMAASILGNSALTATPQPAFVRGDITLAALGFETETPSCILVGQESLQTALEAIPDLTFAPDQRVAAEPTRDVVSGTTGEAEIIVAFLNLTAVDRILDAYAVAPPPPKEPGMSGVKALKMRQLIRKTNAYIIRNPNNPAKPEVQP